MKLKGSYKDYQEKNSSTNNKTQNWLDAGAGVKMCWQIN